LKLDMQKTHHPGAIVVCEHAQVHDAVVQGRLVCAQGSDECGVLTQLFLLLGRDLGELVPGLLLHGFGAGTGVVEDGLGPRGGLADHALSRPVRLPQQLLGVGVCPVEQGGSVGLGLAGHPVGALLSQIQHPGGVVLVIVFTRPGWLPHRRGRGLERGHCGVEWTRQRLLVTLRKLGAQIGVFSQ
jgi:hypothetical protein